VGQPADLVIVDADPKWLVDACGSNAAAASDAVRQMPVWMTISQGIVTHDQSV
jgi:hypothetical protein